MGYEDESLYATIGIPVIFILGFLGALLPSVLARIFPKYGITQKLYFSFFNGMAGGLIIAVGFIHSLPEAFESLESVLTDDSMTHKYPWAAFIALMAIIILFTAEELLDLIATRFGIESFDSHGHGHGHGHASVAKDHSHHTAHDDHACDHTVEEHVAMDGQCDAQPLEELCTHGHNEDVASLSASSDESDSDLEAGKKDVEGGSSQGGTVSTADKKDGSETSDKDRTAPGQPSAMELIMKMIMLFIGLFFHNVFVGLALGIAENDYVLFIAVLFHQFFEGIGMGSRVAMAKLPRIVVVLVIDLLFALTPVIFIGIGIGIKNAVQDTDSSEGYNVTKGTFQALSAGMLIYVGLIHMMRGYRDIGAIGIRLDFHRLASYLGLLLGAGIMSVIGIWA